MNAMSVIALFALAALVVADEDATAVAIRLHNENAWMAHKHVDMHHERTMKPIMEAVLFVAHHEKLRQQRQRTKGEMKPQQMKAPSMASSTMMSASSGDSDMASIAAMMKQMPGFPPCLEQAILKAGAIEAMAKSKTMAETKAQAVNMEGMLNVICDDGCLDGILGFLKSMMAMQGASAPPLPTQMIKMMAKAVCIKDDAGALCAPKLMVMGVMMDNNKRGSVSTPSDSDLDFMCGPCLLRTLSAVQVVQARIKKQDPKFASMMSGDGSGESEKGAMGAPTSGAFPTTSGMSKPMSATSATSGMGMSGMSGMDPAKMGAGLAEGVGEIRAGMKMMCIKARGPNGGYCLKDIMSMEVGGYEESPGSAAAAVGMIENAAKSSVLSKVCQNGCFSKFVMGAVTMANKKQGGMYVPQLRNAVKFTCMPDPEFPGTCLQTATKAFDMVKKAGCSMETDRTCTSSTDVCVSAWREALGTQVSPCCIMAVAKMRRESSRVVRRILSCVKPGGNVTTKKLGEVKNACKLQRGTKVAKVEKRIGMACDYAKANWAKLEPQVKLDMAENLGVPAEFITGAAIKACGSVVVDVSMQGYDDASTTNIEALAKADTSPMENTDMAYSASGESMYAPPGFDEPSSASGVAVSLATLLVALVMML